MSMKPEIKHLFEPKSVAIIGASHDISKLGYRFVQNIVSGGYQGKVYPVNPRGGEILGCKVYTSIEEIDDVVDMACTVIPAKYVFDSVKSCADKGVKFNLLISSGFSEVGNTAEEQKIVSYARERGMRIVGPNIFGIYSAGALLNATFGPQHVVPGSVGVITQSGAIGISMIGKMATENIGLSAIISVGNKADVDETDLLEYLIAQKATRTILMYIEGIGAGERLVKALQKTTKKKPVVVLKSGKSRRGALAAASHTGSLSGEDSVFDDIARQCGLLRAETITEALDWCQFLADSPAPKGENTVIITNGGGLGVLAADACEKYNVNLYDDVQILKKIFNDALPEFGSAKNPVDITGQATTSYYDLALKAALKNRSIHSVICLGCETAVFDAAEFSRIAQERYGEYKAVKPLTFALFGGAEIEKSINQLKKGGIPVFADVYEAVSLMGALYASYRHRKQPAEVIEKPLIGIYEIKEIVRKVRAEKRRFLLAKEAQGIMKAIGIKTPKSYTATSLQEAVKYAEEIGYPVVLKIVSRDIIHKSDAGGVALDLHDEKEVLDAYEAIMDSARNYKPDALIEGIEVSEMVQSDIETIVGARRDHAFGPIVMFGLGGIYVEVMKDIAFRAFPLGRNETMKMIQEIRSYPLLLGVRGEKRKDIEAVADAINKVGTVLMQCKDISDIEINPLIVYDYGEGVKAVDARILLSEPREAHR